MGEYVLFAAAVGLVVHFVSGRFLTCVIVGTMLCSAGNLVHEAWRAGWNVNLGWAPPLFAIGVFLAMPVMAIVGWPCAMVREWGRQRAEASGEEGIAAGGVGR